MEHHPVASNSFLCLNLWVAGDVIAQYSEHKLLHDFEAEKRKDGMTAAPLEQQHKQHPDPDEASSSSSSSSSLSSTSLVDGIDPMRVLTSAGYGAFVYGPLLAVWYPYLDRMCKAYKIAQRFGAWGAPIAKVIADELIMTPPCLFLFFGYMNLCEGGTVQKYENKLKGEFFSSWLASITFWPPISLATFRFLPVYAQAPVINAVCILWDAFLSHRNAVANINEKRQQVEGGVGHSELETSSTAVETSSSSSSIAEPVVHAV